MNKGDRKRRTVKERGRGSEWERKRERETDRQTDRLTSRDRQRQR